MVELFLRKVYIKRMISEKHSVKIILLGRILYKKPVNICFLNLKNIMIVFLYSNMLVTLRVYAMHYICVCITHTCVRAKTTGRRNTDNSL